MTTIKLTKGLALKSALALLGLATIGGLAMTASMAVAVPDAGLDAVIRPAFGLLLRPPVRHVHPLRPDWRVETQVYGWRGGYGSRFRGGWGNPGWRVQHGYASQGPIETITVDCADPSLGPTPLADALDALDDGGTIYIRNGARACSESLVITRTVTLVGEPLSAFASAPPPAETAVIAPPPGMPCLRIGPGVKAVEIRDLTFQADQAGRAGCIESWDSSVAMTRTHVRYSGDGSALFVSHGKLIVRESTIESGGYDPAVALEDASAELHKVRITANVAGIDAGLTGGGGLSLEHVDIMGVGGSDSAESTDVGLMVRRGRGEASNVDVRNSRVTGFKTALWFQHGAKVEVNQTWIGHARVGVVSEGANLELKDSAVNAGRTGIYIAGGHAEIVHNRIFGFTDSPIDVDPNADVIIRENWIYPANDCRPYTHGYDRWCHNMGEVPDSFRDRDHDHEPGHWGWEGGPFDYPPPMAPPSHSHHWWD